MNTFTVTNCTFGVDAGFHSNYKFKVEFDVSLELMMALRASGDGLDVKAEVATILGNELVEVILANMGKINEPKTNGYISLDVLKPILASAGMRLIKHKLETNGIRIWVHLNDLRFADLDKFTETLSEHDIELDDEYEGGVNELRLVMK